MNYKLLFFSASWCGPCREMKSIVEKLPKESVINVDVNNETSMVEAYGVKSVPTFILINEDSMEIDRVTGSTSLAVLKNLLDK